MKFRHVSELVIFAWDCILIYCSDGRDGTILGHR